MLTNAPPPHPFFSLKYWQTYLKWIDIYSGFCSQAEMDCHWQWLASLNELEPSLDSHPLNQGVVCGPFTSLRAHLASIGEISPSLGLNACCSRPVIAILQAVSFGQLQSCLPNLTHVSSWKLAFGQQKHFSVRLPCRRTHLKESPLKPNGYGIAFR